MNNIELIKWIRELEEADEMYKFYKSRVWLELRQEVMEEYHNECSICRQKGKITKATTVHHIYHVKDYPQYALSVWITDADGKKIRNLIPVCNACHNQEHPEKVNKMIKRSNKKIINEERW